MRIAVRRLVSVASIGWLAAILLGTFLASRPSVGTAAYALSLAIYQTGALVCHQLSERSFYLWGRQMPVCARCTGLYGGAALAAAVALTGRVERIRGQLWNRSKVVLSAAAVPTAMTLLYEWTTGAMPSHWVRALTALPLGAAVMLIVVAAATMDSAVEVH
jgi:uncharacterized membrane protein